MCLYRYLVFYCPVDLVYCCAALLPLRLVLSGMKEVTRTWKVLGGVTQAHGKYKDSLLVMIAIGWAKGRAADAACRRILYRLCIVSICVKHIFFLFFYPH